MPETPIYDLMLLLSTTVEDDRRAKVLSEVESAISGAGGSIVHNGDWGTRPLTYGIDHQNEAEYHLLQFTGPVELLESLNHSLGIADGVLRFRIIKVLPGTPPPPKPAPVAVHVAPAMAAAPAAPPSPPEAVEDAEPAEAAPSAGEEASEADEPEAAGAEAGAHAAEAVPAADETPQAAE